ncbi:hypothetical protein APS67_006289 [Streptomyces sp. AVP053U2]|uniref:hypothetical protein n=1 Tax=unclassified Streptomyces TaxID=2593676 RepID=UPI00073BFE49|nr:MULTISPECIES: hypothetical protein [unclassified Streptomyces]ODA69543.1 hypothetical protein APS67_006289 [Streptomyces sp. AVP053U2]
MRARAVHWGARGAVLGLGALWWWAATRLLLAPDAGVREAALAAGGWGLSLIPVHCMPKGRAKGALADGRWRRARPRRAGDGAPAAGIAAGGDSPPTPSPGGTSPEDVTGASPHPRSGWESGPW